MGIRVVALLVSLVLTGCGSAAESEVVSMPEMTAADLAECRKLGGKAVYVEYQRDGASTRTIVQVSLSPDNEMARDVGDGGTGADLDARRRAVLEKLQQMPSCLDQARGGAVGEG